MSKFLVSGAAGFIGSHLCERLIHDSHEVIGIDDLSAYENLNNLKSIVDNKNFKFVKLDISDWHQLTKNFGYFKNIDCIFHCAALSRIQPSISNPVRTHEVNVNGTFFILEMMRMLGIDKIVYSASSSSYGRKNKLPLKENMLPDTLTPYAATKYQAEIYCKTWGNIYDIKNVSLKYFNVYGPRSPINIGSYSPVVSLFFKQVLKDKQPMTVVGDGLQRRDLTYIGDVVDANVKSYQMLSDEVSYSKVSGQTINIGTGTNYAVIELARKVRDILQNVHPNAQIIHVPFRQGEAQITLADITLAKKLLNWSPQVTLDQGLEVLKSYYLDHGF